ncbi:MAG: hypothetical protein WBP22_00825 [Candidatus Saccharimonas sp.]
MSTRQEKAAFVVIDADTAASQARLQGAIEVFLEKHRGKPGMQRFFVTTGYRTGWLHRLLTMGYPHDVYAGTAGWLLEYCEWTGGSPDSFLSNQVVFGLTVDGQIVMSNRWTTIFDPDLQLKSVADVNPKYLSGFCELLEKLDAKFS